MLETLAKGFRAARQKLTGKVELDDDVMRIIPTGKMLS